MACEPQAERSRLTRSPPGGAGRAPRWDLPSAQPWPACLHRSSASASEGASGYFAVFIGEPIGGLAGLALGAPLVLRRAGHRGAAVGGRVGAVGLVGLAAAGMAAFWLMCPLVNANGPAPRLVLEIRLPPGVAISTPRAGDTVELQTADRMPASLAPGRVDDGRDVSRAASSATIAPAAHAGAVPAR